jgi:hypothetical protein
MKPEDKKDLSQFLRAHETPPKYRVCAHCLEEVEREKYNQHMREHGYETLEVLPMK